MLMGEFILSTIKIEQPSGRILEHRGKNKPQNVHLFVNIDKLSDFVLTYGSFFAQSNSFFIPFINTKFVALSLCFKRLLNCK